MGFFKPKTLEKRTGTGGTELRVVKTGAKLRLDATSVNYSFGALHDVFAEAFESAGVYSLNPQSVLLLGMGAGSVVDLLNRRCPPRKIVAVDIDQTVIDIARRHFSIERHANLTIIHDCAARFLANHASEYDLCVVDVFVDNLTPENCETDAFLQDLRRATRRTTLFNRLTETADNRRRNEAFATRFVRRFPKHERLALPHNDVWVGRV